MILIALGANLPGPFGTPEDSLRAVKSALEVRNIHVTAMSGIWLTEPVPPSDQPWYRNAVAAVETDLSPEALFRVLKRIERDFGRTSAALNAARVLDLDILGYNNVIRISPALNIPHPRLHQRAFVLYPLREIAPEWVHPVLKKTPVALIAALPEGQGVVRPQDSRAA